MEPTPLEQQIGDLELAIERLRSLYDQYFMGIERIEPAVPRKDVDRKIYALRKEQIRNTALRFRFQMILQRYNTFQSHWQRICREIENGTYKRQLYRSERKRAAELVPEVLPEPNDPPPRNMEAELEELDREFAPALPRVAAAPPAAPLPPPRPPPIPTAAKMSLVPTVPQAAPAAGKASPPVPAAARATAPAPKPPPLPAVSLPPLAPLPPRRDEGLPDYRVRQLYVEYVEAKRRQKESTATLTYEGLAETLRASSAKLREKHGKAVDFEVGVKDGKAVLRPRIK